MAKTVLIDSDSIFAIYNPNDSLNSQATQTFQLLVARGYQLIYPTPVLFEIISLFQRVLPTPTITKKFIEMIKNDEILISTIDLDILKEAALLFDPAGSKKNTLVDCSIVVIAKRINADGVFSYDSFYSKQGLELAEELIKN